LSNCGFRDIGGYNAAHDREELTVANIGEDDSREYERLPFIMVVVDELSDLMMIAARDVEDSICRLAQMARAVGIHLVVATQRPSVNVITGVIKANIPARLAFAVSSLADSRVILDQQGAERLVGKGDMLLLGPSSSTPQRIQGAWVEESEVREVVATWKAQADSRKEEQVGQELHDAADASLSNKPIADITEYSSRPISSVSKQDDELYEEARNLVISSQLGSTSMLQRKLRVGFARAGRLMDLLEESGVVGPSSGSKAREVFILAEDYEISDEESF
jgi:S-DNA-T family DNA segregation ATPase FtsK/SpoIIIE